LARNVLGLQDSISMDVVFPSRTNDDDPVAANLWEFNPDRIATLTGTILPECTPETGTGQNFRLVRQIYAAEGSKEASVPILYDKKSRRIVTNESADIIRMLNKQAAVLGSSLPDDERPDLYPVGGGTAQLRGEIDELNEQIYVNINNGAYKAGFSSSQDVYALAYENYFQMLAKLEQRLAADNRPYLTGGSFTEADLRLFPTLYRHDPVYYLRMKLNGAKILDYPHLWRWMCRVYALPGVASSNSLVHCRQGYFGRSWNNVVPLGPTHPMSYPQAYSHPELAD
jgi:putative glutathione S-transferase